MMIAGNKQRACISGCLMAALVLFALNAYQFMSLEQQPLIGNSPTVKMLQAKLQQFDRSVADGALSFKNQINLLGVFNSSSSDPRPKSDPSASSDPNVFQGLHPQPIGLPTLSGVMYVLGPHGAAYYQAILDGRVCRETDKISKFTVVKISPTEVVVRRLGRNWTLPCPTPYFSSDQGD